MMIVAGIDVGGKNVHVVIKKDGQILGKAAGPSGIKKAEAVEALYDEVLKKAGLSRKDVERVVATGSSSKRVAFANGFIPDAAADARGVTKLRPTARTIIDVGAEEGRAIKVSADGKVLDFAINEKCAAGTGTFVEAMSRALEVSVDEMSKITLSVHPDPFDECAVRGLRRIRGGLPHPSKDPKTGHCAGGHECHRRKNRFARPDRGSGEGCRDGRGNGKERRVRRLPEEEHRNGCLRAGGSRLYGRHWGSRSGIDRGYDGRSESESP